jgi:hypothetical protein
MSLLKTILEANNGGAVKALAQNFGLSNQQAGSAVSKLLPALTQGMKTNVAQKGGLDALLGALNKGGHQRYVDNPTELAQANTVAEGNNILGHLLGSKDVSRQVASQAAEQTGIDTGILKKMLPMIASLAMGSLSKQSGSGGALAGMLGGNSGGNSSAAGGLLSGFLDADGDGSMADDLLGMVAKKFF